jgi:hypothetical protein
MQLVKFSFQTLATIFKFVARNLRYRSHPVPNWVAVPSVA